MSSAPRASRHPPLDDDAAFLAYCAAHCRSERAQFTRDEVRRLYRLAGMHLTGALLPAHVTLRPGIADPLVKRAREALRSGAV